VQCSAAVNATSFELHKNLTRIATNWWPPDAQGRGGWNSSTCARPFEAFDSSVLNRGDPSNLVRFVEKLETCQAEDAVSIVVFGGSETMGHTCEKKGPVPPTGFLGLPYENLTLHLTLGNSECPWANRFYTTLRAQYPACGRIDVYNLAMGATTQAMYLGRLHEFFFSAKGARGGRTLEEVVDLVVVEYGVNDAFVNPKELKREGISPNENAANARLEAISEYFVNFVQALPRRPALVYHAGRSPEGVMDPMPAYLEAGARLGIPVSSYLHVMAWPDDPHYSARSAINRKESDFGYASISDQVSLGGSCSQRTGFCSNYVVENNPLLTANRTRLNNFFNCWGFQTHPHKPAHALIAQVLHHFIHVQVAAARSVLTACSSNTSDALNFQRQLPSPFALAMNSVLNPHRLCPKGPLTEVVSAVLYKVDNNDAIYAMGPNANTKWKLVEDRNDKFGFVIEAASGNHTFDTLSFDINISSTAALSIEYMHTYENAGRIDLKLEQKSNQKNGSKVDSHSSHGAVMDSKRIRFGQSLHPGGSVVIDSYEPAIRNSMYTTTVFSPVGYQPGEAILHVRLLEQSTDEKASRGGGRFKLVGIRSC